MPDKLIIFDYSGTLSPEMAVFSRPDNLVHQLKKSGLFALGLDSTALFWEIINATWMQGSTTVRGYKMVLQEGISELFPKIAQSRQPEVSNAVSHFVDAYFGNSYIDEHWRPVLKKLSENSTVQVIIATDHYAEATKAIIKFLGQWNIPAMPVAAGRESNFVVANSADLGMHKDEQPFWQAVKGALQSNYKRILLLDDFGQNEQEGDAYGDQLKVNERKQAVIKMLRTKFAADVEIVSFVIKDEQICGLVTEISAKIDRFLLGNSNSGSEA